MLPHITTGTSGVLLHVAGEGSVSFLRENRVRLSLTLLTLAVVVTTLPVVAPAANVEVFSQEARVQTAAPGVALIITDFWDKPVEFAFAGVPEDGRWTYLVQYKGVFHVQARDLTSEELRDIEVEARLQRLESELSAIRGQAQ